MAGLRSAWRSTDRWLRRGLVTGLYGMLIALLVFVVWARQVVPADQSARFAMESDETVIVSRSDWISFRPRDADPSVGLVFYPGGKAEPVAYAPVLRALAASGFLVVLYPMPLNLATLAPDAADKVIAAYPEIRRWVVAGHSLGGVMVARYAERHADRVSGLVLWASYPAAFTDLSATDLPVLTLLGTEDMLADRETITAAHVRLPGSARIVPLKGGDHWGFGHFSQVANRQARDAQQAELLAATVAFMEEIAGQDDGN